MDFFHAQDNARRSTWRLVALFVAAVVSLVLLTNLLVAAVYAWASNHLQPGRLDLGTMLANLPAGYWATISLGVVGVIALASGVRYLQVRSGGRAIAEALGGRLLQHGTGDLREQRLLNVVEEMAIASGMPVPPVYLIEEPSINAFAAGFGTDDAVIGVNRGTLEHLNREELQGVIGHEFSHVLNGDSRINLRLIAVLHGILFIGLLGRGILYGVGRGAGHGRSRRSGSSAAGPALALGLGLLVIGYAGTFFGNLIKAAVSRQREYLADAAAVQFTRNPYGIAGALKKIGGHSAGSIMRSSAAREASHIFFGQAQRVWLGSWMATHPPLERRIRALDPHWDGTYPVLAANGAAPAQPGAAETAGVAALADVAAPPAETSAAASPVEDALEVLASPDEVAAAVGRLDQSSLDSAVRLIDGLPVALRDAAHDPFFARALLLALVLGGSANHRQRQGAALHQRALVPEVDRLAPLAAGLHEQQKLTLVEMAVPALKQLSPAQYRHFIDDLIGLIKSDRRVDLFEWVLHRVLVKELKPHFEGETRERRTSDLAALRAEALVLLSALAREGGRSPAETGHAFTVGLDALGAEGDLDAADDPNFARLNQALVRLRTVKPLQKPRLIKACAATALADGHVSPREGALLQGIAAALDCPLPPSIYAARRSAEAG